MRIALKLTGKNKKRKGGVTGLEPGSCCIRGDGPGRAGLASEETKVWNAPGTGGGRPHDQALTSAAGSRVR